MATKATSISSFEIATPAVAAVDLTGTGKKHELMTVEMVVRVAEHALWIIQAISVLHGESCRNSW